MKSECRGDAYIIRYCDDFVCCFQRFHPVLCLELAKGMVIFMSKEIISTECAPKAIGPYSQGNKFNDLVFISGRLPLNPVTGQLVGEIVDQARQSLDNLKAILEEAGSSLNKVVKTTGVFIGALSIFLY